MLHASFVGAKPVPLKARPLSPMLKGACAAIIFKRVGLLRVCVAYMKLLYVGPVLP
jgi:hypothetical protein